MFCWDHWAFGSWPNGISLVSLGLVPLLPWCCRQRQHAGRLLEDSCWVLWLISGHPHLWYSLIYEHLIYQTIISKHELWKGTYFNFLLVFVGVCFFHHSITFTLLKCCETKRITSGYCIFVSSRLYEHLTSLILKGTPPVQNCTRFLKHEDALVDGSGTELTEDSLRSLCFDNVLKKINYMNYCIIL